MKQIITQHGWGLNKYFWDDYKVDFLNNNWHWQDNERGYFSTNNYQAKWIKSESKKEIRMTLCHSFGFHLMQKKILKEATHIVLINSFNNFLPLSNKRNYILRSLKRMETKIIKDDHKVDFLKNNWHWQDNERGYFSTNNYQAKWIKSESKKEIRMILCHSFGFHLMPKKILKDATHIILINSFNNFLPLSNKRNFILRSLKRMEKKIIKDEPKDMLKEFIYRSFMPNHMNNSFKNIFYKSLESLNKTLLLSDLKELYINRDFPVFLRKDCKIIFIKSENDLILDNESNNNFLDSLNKTLERKPILIKLAQQGHCLNNLNLYEILRNTLND